MGLSFLPVVVLYLYVVKLSFVYDPTPFVLGIVLAGVVILVWSRKVYDFSNLASGILLDSMSDGVIGNRHFRRLKQPRGGETYRRAGRVSTGYAP